MREFFWNLRQWGIRVAIYNAMWRWVHRNDDFVRAWKIGEECSGCDRCP